MVYMAIDRAVGSESFEIGIESDTELDNALTNVIEKAKTFDNKFGELKKFFSLTDGESHLWVGQDADAFRDVVTKPGGIIYKLNRYHEQIESMGALASELRRVITDTKDQLKQNIHAIDGGE
jgi:hypothetical protein